MTVTGWLIPRIFSCSTGRLVLAGSSPRPFSYNPRAVTQGAHGLSKSIGKVDEGRNFQSPWHVRVTGHRVTPVQFERVRSSAESSVRLRTLRGRGGLRPLQIPGLVCYYGGAFLSPAKIQASRFPERKILQQENKKRWATS
jgi:hypothetical protein